MTASFRAGETVQHREGQRVHPQQAEHSGRLEQRFYQVGEHVWCFVGNGLSNQTFVRAPEGIIAIDTGRALKKWRPR